MSNELKTILEAILVDSHKLHQFLKRESDLLANKQFGELTELAQEKQQLIDELNQLDIQRQAFSSDSDFSRYLETTDASLKETWKAIQFNMRQCQQLNEINGRLLQRQHQIARETMELLTGRQVSQSSVYNADGSTSSGASLITKVEA